MWHTILRHMTAYLDERHGDVDLIQGKPEQNWPDRCEAVYDPGARDERCEIIPSSIVPEVQIQTTTKYSTGQARHSRPAGNRGKQKNKSWSVRKKIEARGFDVSLGERECGRQSPHILI